MYRASQFIKNVKNSRGKEIAIGYVTETDAWKRSMGLPAQIQQDWAAVADKYKETLKDDTVKVVMKEAEHPSQSDATAHYSALELDKDGKVIASSHYYK